MKIQLIDSTTCFGDTITISPRMPIACSNGIEQLRFKPLNEWPILDGTRPSGWDLDWAEMLAGKKFRIVDDHVPVVGDQQFASPSNKSHQKYFHR